MIIVGVDPGATHTGIVVAEFDRVTSMDGKILDQDTIVRDNPIDSYLPVDNNYLQRVRIAVSSFCHTFEPDAFGIECVERPSWFVGGKAKPTNPEPIIATAVVMGIALAVGLEELGRAQTYQIPVGGNGAGAFVSYPAVLVSNKERAQPNWRMKQAGKGKHCHERSAYDVAVQTVRTIRRGKR